MKLQSNPRDLTRPRPFCKIIHALHPGRVGRQNGVHARAVGQQERSHRLKRGVFAENGPERIAASLKRLAERDRRRKANPYHSALSLLTFYINRAGKNIPATKRKTIERAKVELRKKFNSNGRHSVGA
ncbi:MAG: DUF3175 domain-containing protein [Xanthobacteraceae bacterium]